MKLRKTDKGFTLVEMIISIAIFAVMMTTVAGVLSSMSKMFGSAQREIELQDSAQTTFSVLSTLIKESQAIPVGESHKSSVEVIGNDLYIYSETVDQAKSAYKTKVAADSATLHVVHFDATTNKLYLYSTDYKPEDQVSEGAFSPIVVSSSSMTKGEYLLSKNVESISYKDESANGYIVMSLNLKYGTRKASISQNVYLRNSNLAVRWTNGTDEEKTEESTATPTPTPTTAPALNVLTLTYGGVDCTPVKENICTNNNIKVCYGSTATKTGKKVSVTEYSYVCAVCGGTNFDVYNWGFQCHNYSSPHNNNNQINYNNGDLAYYVSIGAIKQTSTTTMKDEVVYSNELIIRNESLTSDIDETEVIVYLQDDDAYFDKFSDGAYLSLVQNKCTKVTTEAKYWLSEPQSGRYVKYLRIKLGKLEKAEAYTENGVDKVRYSQYVFKFNYKDDSGNEPVVCTYSVTTN